MYAIRSQCRLALVTSFFAVLAVDVGVAWAQSEATVRGQVVAAADGSAVAGAPVSLRPSAAGAPSHISADAGGRFVFMGLRPGEYILSAVMDGFAPRELRLVVAPREVRSVTLALDVGGLAVTVDVVAARTWPSTHSPSSTLLPPERLDEMPLAQRTNLPDAIVTAAPGMIRGHDDSCTSADTRWR